VAELEIKIDKMEANNITQKPEEKIEFSFLIYEIKVLTY
jgi:hypothetical protein